MANSINIQGTLAVYDKGTSVNTRNYGEVIVTTFSGWKLKSERNGYFETAFNAVKTLNPEVAAVLPKKGFAEVSLTGYVKTENWAKQDEKKPNWVTVLYVESVESVEAVVSSDPEL